MPPPKKAPPQATLQAVLQVHVQQAYGKNHATINRRTLAQALAARAVVIAHMALWAMAAIATAGTALAGASTSQKNTGGTPLRCHVLVVGDSLSAAYGLPVNQGWVALLQTKLRQTKPQCTVFNASISGDTSAGGKARLAALLQTQKPTLMLLALGGNDGLRGLPITTMKQNLADMLRAAKQSGSKTLLIGMRIPPNYGPQYSQAFAQAFADVAHKQGSAHVPFLLEGFADKPDWFQADGIHPNARAQSTMLNTVWPSLKSLLPLQ